MKVMKRLLLAMSVLLPAYAHAWDPSVGGGWVDTFEDRCPIGCIVGPVPPARFHAEGWACSKLAAGGTFDPNKLVVVRNWNSAYPVPYQNVRVQIRPDVLAAGACNSAMVGFVVDFNNAYGTYNVFQIYYDGVQLDTHNNGYLLGAYDY